jgi:hypothetical protein
LKTRAPGLEVRGYTPFQDPSQHSESRIGRFRQLS